MLPPFVGRSHRLRYWQHYPANDAVDATGRWQFYFHAHDPAEADGARHPQEHGHIHLFRRDALGRLSHLAGLSLDAQGQPLGWFATNQWVTGERWMAAASLARGLSDMELCLRGPLAGVARWLAELVRLYAEPLRDMLLARDEALARHCQQRQISRQAARADRRVAVWSSFPMDGSQGAQQRCDQLPGQAPARSTV